MDYQKQIKNVDIKTIMKRFSLGMLFFFSFNIYSQVDSLNLFENNLKAVMTDTVKIYNFTGDCTYPQNKVIFGGRFIHFIRPEKINQNFKSEFCKQSLEFDKYASLLNPFILQLYNSNDELIFEGGRYLYEYYFGSFKLYKKERLKLKGKYGLRVVNKNDIDVINQYKTGTWYFFRKNGTVKKVKKFK